VELDALVRDAGAVALALATVERSELAAIRAHADPVDGRRLLAYVDDAQRSLRVARGACEAAATGGRRWLSAHGAADGGRAGLAGAPGGAAAGAPLDPAFLPPNDSVWTSDPAGYEPPSAADWVGMAGTLTPHSRPDAFAPGLNDGGTAVVNRRHNCADCARAVIACWQGVPQVSAGRTPDPVTGEPRGEGKEPTEAWAGQAFAPVDVEDVADRLIALGPGSAAIVAVLWTVGGGHMLNAVNHRGTVQFVDGQSGRWGPWPPTVSSAGYGPEHMATVEAIFFP